MKKITPIEVRIQIQIQSKIKNLTWIRIRVKKSGKFKSTLVIAVSMAINPWSTLHNTRRWGRVCFEYEPVGFFCGLKKKEVD